MPRAACLLLSVRSHDICLWQWSLPQLGAPLVPWDDRALPCECTDPAALLPCRWQDARLMPGAARLLWHLHSHGIPMALATSTPRATYEAKMCGKAAQSLCSIFQASALHAHRL